MPESAERPRLERSAGGVVVRHFDDTPHLLLILDPYGKWGLPKGHLEPGEAARDAALREVREETGLSALRLGPSVGTIDWYFRDGGRLVHKFCDFYLMTSPSGDAEPEVEEGITEVRWVPAARAADEITYDNAREIVVQAVQMLDEAP